MGHKFLLCPFFRVGATRQSRGGQHFAVVGKRNVEIVHQDDIRILQEPVAAPVESRKNGRMHITAVDTLKSNKENSVIELKDYADFEQVSLAFVRGISFRGSFL